MYTLGFRNNRFNYSTSRHALHFYFYKSDHANLIGRQELVAVTAHRGSRRCRRNAALGPILPLLHEGGGEFSQLRGRPSRLFVIREAAGEISRRSADYTASATLFLRSSAPLTMSRQIYEHAVALHSFRIHPEEHANDFIIT